MNGPDKSAQCQNNDDLWIHHLNTSLWLMFLKYRTCMFVKSPVFDSVFHRDETINLLQTSVSTSAENGGASACISPLIKTFTLSPYFTPHSHNRVADLYITTKRAQ